MIVGECAASHQCCYNRNLQHLGKFAQRRCCTCFQNTAADIQNWFFGAQDEVRCFFDHARMTFCVWFVARQRIFNFVLRWPVPTHGVLQHIFRHVDEHWARAASSCDMKRLTNCHRQIFGAHDQVVVLRDAACNANGVALLECVGTNCARANLARDGNHRNGVHICVAQRRNHVGCCGTTCHHGNTWAARDMCVTLGHVPSALFVTNQDMTDRRLDQWVVRGQDATARQTKHHFHVFHFQAANERLRAGDLFALFMVIRLPVGCHFLSPVWSVFGDKKSPPSGRLRHTRQGPVCLLNYYYFANA